MILILIHKYRVRLRSPKETASTTGKDSELVRYPPSSWRWRSLLWHTPRVVPTGTRIGPVWRSAGALLVHDVSIKWAPLSLLYIRLSRVQKEQRKRRKCWWETFEFVFFSLSSPGVAIEPPNCAVLFLTEVAGLADGLKREGLSTVEWAQRGWSKFGYVA